MTNAEYFEELTEKISQLQELRLYTKTIAKQTIGNTLTTKDMFFCAAMDRCMKLIDGLIPARLWV